MPPIRPTRYGDAIANANLR